MFLLPPIDSPNCSGKRTLPHKVDWQVHLFGNAMHAFATPGASDPEAGILYDPVTATRAWSATQSFLSEVLAPPTK